MELETIRYFASVIAYVILYIGILAQMKKVLKAGNADVISLLDIFGRLGACVLFMIVYSGINNSYLIQEQILFTVLFLIYIGIIIALKLKPKNRSN